MRQIVKRPERSPVLVRGKVVAAVISRLIRGEIHGRMNRRTEERRVKMRERTAGSRRRGRTQIQRFPNELLTSRQRRRRRGRRRHQKRWLRWVVMSAPSEANEYILPGPVDVSCVEDANEYPLPPVEISGANVENDRITSSVAAAALEAPP
jgi:hypothetical protein